MASVVKADKCFWHLGQAQAVEKGKNVFAPEIYERRWLKCLIGETTQARNRLNPSMTSAHLYKKVRYERTSFWPIAYLHQVVSGEGSLGRPQVGAFWIRSTAMCWMVHKLKSLLRLLGPSKPKGMVVWPILRLRRCQAWHGCCGGTMQKRERVATRRHAEMPTVNFSPRMYFGSFC